MNARTDSEQLLPPMHSPERLSNTQLDALEEEAIFI
ncbi:MAG: sulfate adenylyltransferase small subunit, partial [Variovorax sp.]